MYRWLLWLLFLLPSSSFSQNVVINEILASNQTVIDDEDGNASDYIELFNSGSEPVQLQGFGLSDDPAVRKWRFSGSTLLASGEFLLVFASDKNKRATYWHTNFKVSASGETIVLTDTAGAVIDRVDLPASGADIAYGRIRDGFLPWIFQTPSPGAKNTGTVIKPLSNPVVASRPAGFYPSAITVELSAGSSNIYYTVDGSDPDSSSSKYSIPIPIQQTTVLKAISTQADHQPSKTMYQTYFINENTDLPVISLSSDPYNLFDYQYGIYANGPGWTPTAPNYGANFWMDWERPAHVEFFEDDERLGFSEDCGIAIYGAYTRSFPQKSISVKFKNDYGVSEINYRLFPDLALTTFKSFVLRNSGNDFYYTHIRDAMMQTLIKDLDIDYLEYRPAAAFINGQYWGIYNIREKISEHYVANRHNVDPDNIDMLENDKQVLQGDVKHYQTLIDYISSQNMATEDAYTYIKKMIDLDECLLYFAAEVYYNSQDWPANNIKYWREHSATGKWRWILFDLDFGFNLYETNGQAENHLTYLLSGVETRPGSNPPWSTLLPRKLLENPTIKNQFINLIADLLNTNFESTRVISLIQQMSEHIGNEIGRHRQRWNLSQQTANSHLQRMISFAKERPGYLRGFVRSFFRCGSDGKITIHATPGGKIKLNSLCFTSQQLPWSGLYFQGNPIHLEAIPDPGYSFSGWTGAINTSDLAVTLSVASASTLTASFSAQSSTVDETAGQERIPDKLQLGQNYPNPFNPVTTIAFSIPKTSMVTLKIYDLLGREIAVLVAEKLAAGMYSVKWDAGTSSAGLYLYRLQAGNNILSRKLLLVR